jgi:hypothetical protein
MNNLLPSIITAILALFSLSDWGRNSYGRKKIFEMALQWRGCPAVAAED